MRQNDYLSAFKQLAADKFLLTNRKNKDYADNQDAFANFRLIEVLTHGRISTEEGILVRMTDKLQRIANLLYKRAAVSDEAITDTLKDLSIYADILNIYLQHQDRQP